MLISQFPDAADAWHHFVRAVREWRATVIGTRLDAGLIAAVRRRLRGRRTQLCCASKVSLGRGKQSARGLSMWKLTPFVVACEVIVPGPCMLWRACNTLRLVAVIG